MARLTVDEGQTHTVDSGEEEFHDGLDNYGTTDVYGNLTLTESPEEEWYIGEQPIDLPLAPINLQLRKINFSTMNMGLSIFLVGMLGLLYGAAGLFKNYVAGALISLAVLALILSGTLGIGLEIFWVLIALTAISLATGVILRWT